MTYVGLRFLHILFMASWFGSALFASGDVKRTLAAGPDHIDLLRERMRRFQRVAGVSAVLTILTGFALIFQVGGFGAVPVPIHIGLTLGLVAWGLGIGTGLTWRKIDAELEAGKSPADLQPLAKRLTGLTMGFHTTWLLTLILMVFRNQLM